MSPIERLGVFGSGLTLIAIATTQIPRLLEIQDRVAGTEAGMAFAGIFGLLGAVAILGSLLSPSSRR